MQSGYITELLNQSSAWPLSSSAVRDDSSSSEINVIHTDQHATAVALNRAAVLARGLGMAIHLRAAITVPVRLPIDQSPVSVHFTRTLLCRLVQEVESDLAECRVHLYLCRDRSETLLRVLRPHSLVMIGANKRLWSTAATRIAGELRAHGHDVALVDVKRPRR